MKRFVVAGIGGFWRSAAMQASAGGFLRAGRAVPGRRLMWRSNTGPFLKLGHHGRRRLWRFQTGERLCRQATGHRSAALIGGTAGYNWAGRRRPWVFGPRRATIRLDQPKDTRRPAGALKLTDPGIHLFGTQCAVSASATPSIGFLPYFTGGSFPAIRRYRSQSTTASFGSEGYQCRWTRRRWHTKASSPQTWNRQLEDPLWPDLARLQRPWLAGRSRPR